MSELKYVKELLQTSTGTEGSLLIPKKIYDTLIEEVEKALIPRSEAALYFGPADIPGSSIDVDLATPNKLKVRLIGEGAEIALDNADYTSTNIKPLKYGVAIRITKEMMEDAKWNLLAHNVKLAGRRLAENETSLILTAMQACASSVSGGAAITIANITRAIQYLDDYDYAGTSMLVGMEVLNDLRNIDTFVEYQKVGNTEMITKGFQGVLYGLQVMKFSTNAAPSTTYSKYAYVYDKAQAFAIAEKRPVTIENFELPTFDMSGAAVTQRLAVSLLRDLAVARISTS
jgi:HK97 family phage major capsid protein